MRLRYITETTASTPDGSSWVGDCPLWSEPSRFPAGTTFSTKRVAVLTDRPLVNGHISRCTEQH